MRKLGTLLMAATLLMSSCMKDANDLRGETDKNSVIPSDFNWKTTQNVTISVAAPTVDGIVPAYAVVRVFASSVLTEENMVAKGVVKPGATFNAAFTVPASAETLYVQTTSPEGYKSVEMVAVSARVSVGGAQIKAQAKAAIRANAVRLSESSMPTYPTVTPKSESDFDAAAVIRTTPSSPYKIGAHWTIPAVDAYYIPAGAVIEGNIDLWGNESPYPNATLYVAGTLRAKDVLQIGSARLVVLAGGKVEIDGQLMTGNIGKTQAASFYIFEGGEITAESANLGSQCMVNCGKLVVSDKLDMNNSAVLYQAPTAQLEADEILLSNEVTVYNDGKITAEDFSMNSHSNFYNYENGVFTIEDEAKLDNQTTLYQYGRMTADELWSQSTAYINCYTKIGTLTGHQQASFYLSAGAALEVEDIEFNGVEVSLASGSMLIVDEYNTENHGGNNEITAVAGVAIKPVVIIKSEAHVKQGQSTQFSGPLEIVYDNDDKKISAKYITNGAVLVAKQTSQIPASVCNGGVEPVEPTPEPEPEPYEEIKGATYTYCFEDRWPWLGDYDMNDVVLVSSVDRLVSADGSKVAKMVINWELAAAGTTVEIAAAVQLDNVLASQVSVETSHAARTAGIFPQTGLESSEGKAVIALFNDTKELLGGTNTWNNRPHAAPVKHTTTITFSPEVDATAVLDSELNFFIAVDSRDQEIHMPGYAQTTNGKFTHKGFYRNEDPYRFYSMGKEAGDNYMMWALMIPGRFSHPTEMNDIRHTYTHFSAWTTSGGTSHKAWYDEEADATKIYNK